MENTWIVSTNFYPNFFIELLYYFHFFFLTGHFTMLALRANNSTFLHLSWCLSYYERSHIFFQNERRTTVNKYGCLHPRAFLRAPLRRAKQQALFATDSVAATQAPVLFVESPILFFYSAFFLSGAPSLWKQHKVHHNFGFFFVSTICLQVSVMDAAFFLKRWASAQSLLFNFFYYKKIPLIFGSIFFKREVLAINWQYSKLSLAVWKYAFPFFIFKTTIFSKRIDTFFARFKHLGFRLFLISDCAYHRKVLYYLNKHKAFSIGLVTAVTDPWVVSFALPILSTRLLAFFFFKIYYPYKKKSGSSSFWTKKKNLGRPFT
jgi:hypothetical protein